MESFEKKTREKIPSLRFFILLMSVDGTSLDPSFWWIVLTVCLCVSVPGHGEFTFCTDLVLSQSRQ